MNARAAWQHLATLPGGTVAGLATSSNGRHVLAATPAGIVARLNSELVKAARDPAYARQMTTLGVEAISSTPQEFGAFVESEVAKWGRAIKESGARVE